MSGCSLPCDCLITDDGERGRKRRKRAKEAKERTTALHAFSRHFRGIFAAFSCAFVHFRAFSNFSRACGDTLSRIKLICAAPCPIVIHAYTAMPEDQLGSTQSSVTMKGDDECNSLTTSSTTASNTQELPFGSVCVCLSSVSMTHSHIPTNQQRLRWLRASLRSSSFLTRPPVATLTRAECCKVSRGKSIYICT